MEVLKHLGLLLIFLGGCFCAVQRRCQDDDKCAENEFCYQRRVCAECHQCAPYNREDTGSCVKDPSSCGNCLKGYETEVLTDGTIRCVQATSTSTATAPTVLSAGVQWEPYWLGLLCLFAVAAPLLLFAMKYRSSSWLSVKQRTHFSPCDESSRSTSSGTLYAPSAPPHAFTVDKSIQDDSEVKFLEGNCYGNKCENFQNAGVFKYPQWVRQASNEHNTNNPAMEAPPVDEVDGPPNPTNTNDDNEAFLMDENTQPSDWSPGPHYGESETAISAATTVPLVTSFEGILRLNAAAPGVSGGAAEPEPNSAQNTTQNTVNVTNITVINTGFNFTNL